MKLPNEQEGDGDSFFSWLAATIVILFIAAVALILTGCESTKPAQLFRVSINGTEYILHDGAKITFRDFRSGRYVPLKIERP